MINIDLTGKVILITGALGAIAEHLVHKLSLAGATLALTDLQTQADASQVLDEWGVPPDRYSYFQLDVCNPAAMRQVIHEAFSLYPQLDTVLGHAGGCGLHPFAATSAEEFEKIFRFNFLAQTSLAREVLTEWVARQTPGHLIFTSSYVARVPHSRIPSYASAKAALECFTKCLALEYGEHRIRVNAVSPGNVAAGSSLKVFDQDPIYREFVLRVSPLERRNSPEAVGDVFVFLCSPLARELNGHVLSVDMGVSIPKIG
jgi:NAD(P)-dependent dehydrogenase (short-subunit alcohol dehydrogenase family)